VEPGRGAAGGPRRGGQPAARPRCGDAVWGDAVENAARMDGEEDEGPARARRGRARDRGRAAAGAVPPQRGAAADNGGELVSGERERGWENSRGES